MWPSFGSCLEKSTGETCMRRGKELWLGWVTFGQGLTVVRR